MTEKAWIPASHCTNLQGSLGCWELVIIAIYGYIAS